jgi:hypothetical protein
MKRAIGRGKFLMALIFFAAGAVLFSGGVAGQDQGWQVTRADYGFKDQRTDVTNLLQDLLSRGGVNGRIAVNNQTMGGDPAVGKDKNLRIFARNRKNQEREFDYKEGSFVPVDMYVVPITAQNNREGRYGSRDWDDHGGRSDYQNRDDWNNLQIIRGFYGVQGRTANVTDLLRSMVRDGALTVNVSNSSMGGDPAIGADKVLIVIYRYQGKEQASAVPEGGTLSIP